MSRRSVVLPISPKPSLARNWCNSGAKRIPFRFNHITTFLQKHGDATLWVHSHLGTRSTRMAASSELSGAYVSGVILSLSPLESALANCVPITPLESALTENRGEGGHYVN